MTEPAGPPRAYLETVRTLGKRGFARAADSLSRLLGRTVQLTLWDVRSVPASVLPALAEGRQGTAPGAPTVGVHIRIRGEGDGCVLILLPSAVAWRILCALMGTPAESRVLTETERSALQEVGNIVASSFLSELGDVLGRRLVPSVPEIHLDDIPRLVRDVIAFTHTFGSDALVVQGLLDDPNRQIEGWVFAMTDVTTLQPMAHGAPEERRNIA